MPSKIDVSMDVPQDIIETHLRSAIASALSKDPAVLVQKVVDAAMQQKKDSYSRETIFQQAVNEMIREAALAEMKNWLGEHRTIVMAALRKRLAKDGGQLMERIADKIIEALGSTFYITCHLKVTDDD